MNQAPLFIKQIEDIQLANIQPFTTDGFARRGREIRQPNPFENRQGQHVEIPLQRDFLPFHLDFNHYIFNKKTGYTEPNIPYPTLTQQLSGFRTNGF